MKSAVIVFPGSNRERDMAHALKLVSGREAAMVWHAEHDLPARTDLVVLPGGFRLGPTGMGVPVKATEKMAAAEDNRAPNVLCEYAFELAQKFSRFYSEHHILSETDADIRAARLGLCDVTLATMVKVLGILGIEVPERM